jgi:hypothetical protein
MLSAEQYSYDHNKAREKRLRDKKWAKRSAEFRARRENPGVQEVRAREKEKTTFNRTMALQRDNNRFQMDKEALTGKNRIAEVRQQGSNLFATTDRQELGSTARKRIEQARLGVNDRLNAFKTIGALSKTKNDMGVETIDTTRLGELSGLINSFAGGPGVEPIRQNAGILDAKPADTGMAGSALSPRGGVSLSAKQPAQQDFIRQPRQSGGLINGIPENEFMDAWKERYPSAVKSGRGLGGFSDQELAARGSDARKFLGGKVDTEYGQSQKQDQQLRPMKNANAVTAEDTRFDKPVLPPDDKKGGKEKSKTTTPTGESRETFEGLGQSRVNIPDNENKFWSSAKAGVDRLKAVGKNLKENQGKRAFGDRRDPKLKSKDATPPTKSEEKKKSPPWNDSKAYAGDVDKTRSKQQSLAPKRDALMQRMYKDPKFEKQFDSQLDNLQRQYPRKKRSELFDMLLKDLKL